MDVHGSAVTLTAVRNLLNPTKVNANKSPEKGKRKNSETDAGEQFESIQKAQQKAKKDRPSVNEGEWEGAKSRPKQRRIESTEKSKQNEKFKNRNQNE